MDDRQDHLRFFGLREQPFAPTADPAYFFAAKSHQECLFRLWNSIDERQGIAVVLGSYGTGKTTLLRKLMAAMAAEPDKYHTAVIGSPIPSWTSFALLESICAQFGLDVAQPSFVACMDALNRELLARRNKICTLIIDDAQNLNKRGQLELLRLVQNLETQQHKLLNLVLLAQMEWAQALRAAPNFEQRINLSYVLGALEFSELQPFISFRLQQAGAGQQASYLFDETALRAIHAYAEGSPRIVVTLCRNALLLAAHLGQPRIGHEIILHTIEKTTLPDPERRARVAKAVMEYMETRPFPVQAVTPREAAPVPSPPAPPQHAAAPLASAFDFPVEEEAPSLPPRPFPDEPAFPTAASDSIPPEEGEPVLSPHDLLEIMGGKDVSEPPTVRPKSALPDMPPRERDSRTREQRAAEMLLRAARELRGDR